MVAYSLVSATTPRQLLAAIVTFATAQGWTIDYNNASVSTGNGGQIGLHSGSCFVAIGEQSSSHNPVNVTGTEDDGRINMALCSAFTATDKYWSHTNSLVTSATDADRVVVNDVLGPMTEVHFFGTVDYIWCIVKSSATRWSQFGFGNLHDKGMSGPQIAFAVGNFFSWFSTDEDIITLPNMANVNSNDHMLFQNASNTSSSSTVIGRGSNYRIPDGYLDPLLGFTDGDVFINRVNIDAAQNFNHHYGTQKDPAGSGVSAILDMMANSPSSEGGVMNNQATTGGVVLMPYPVIYNAVSPDLKCFLGELPGIAAVQLQNLAPGEELEYGSDTYMVFPLKVKGLTTESTNGLPNSYGNGFAILKEAA